MNRNNIILGIIILVLLGIIAYMVNQNLQDQNPQEQPNNEGGHWRIFADPARGLSFRYPTTLMTAYISTVDWPPQVQVVDEPYSCTEAGGETERAGITEKRLADNREYCVTRITEGAAGSIYTQYAYAFPKDGKTAILTFSLRMPQCDNYDEQQKLECKSERETFDLDMVVDLIGQSLVLNASR